MNPYLLASLGAIGAFLTGMTATYNLHPGSRDWLALAMGGATALAPYIVGLAIRPPWGNKEEKS
jgi:hypothetical protein